VALNPGALSARPWSEAELCQWVRRDDEYAIQNLVVGLCSNTVIGRQESFLPQALSW
jgi:hypothetical protein